MQQLSVYVNFKINQDFISKVLCINKEKPELKCHGSCHLAKKLKAINEEDSGQTSSSNKKKSKRSLTLFFTQNPPDNSKLFGLDKDNKTVYFSNFRDYFISEIFQPPRIG